MNVCSESVSQSTFLEWSDGPRFSWLGVHWCDAQPTIGYGSTHTARLSVFNFEQGKSSWSCSGPFQISLCNVSRNGEIKLEWKKGETQIPLTPFAVGLNVFIAVDPEAFAKSNNQAKKAKLIIQRTD